MQKVEIPFQYIVVAVHCSSVPFPLLLFPVPKWHFVTEKLFCCLVLLPKARKNTREINVRYNVLEDKCFGEHQFRHKPRRTGNYRVLPVLEPVLEILFKYLFQVVQTKTTTAYFSTLPILDQWTTTFEISFSGSSHKNHDSLF